jgi:hypothetical protein
MGFVPFHAKGPAGFGLLVVVVLLPISAFHAAKVTEIYSRFTLVYQIRAKNQYAEKGEKVVTVEEVVLFPAWEKQWHGLTKDSECFSPVHRKIRSQASFYQDPAGFAHSF